MEQIWWYLSRSSGIVATVLIVSALIWGFFFSVRATGERHKPNRWLDLRWAQLPPAGRGGGW